MGSSKPWRTAILIALLTTWLSLSAAGCRAPAPALEMRIEVALLETGEPAPWRGYLLSPRALVVLYKQASREVSEDTVRELRLRLGADREKEVEP